MIRTIIPYLVLIVLSAAIITFTQGNSTVVEILVNIIASATIIALGKIFENIQQIWLWVLSNTYYSNVKIRISISYLFKIKVNDKYLLVKSQRIPSQFQPVGGVFKRYRESYFALEGLNVTDDDNIPIDDQSIGDLRIKLPGKNLMPFLKWYNSQLGREVSPYREFYEELIRTDILDQKTFPYLNYLHKRRHQTKIHYSHHFKCQEIIIAEIFEIIADDKQLEMLKETQSRQNDYYIWVKAETIERRGAIPGALAKYSISETSEWIL